MALCFANLFQHTYYLFYVFILLINIGTKKDNLFDKQQLVETSDWPKFGSVPAEIENVTEISVSVPAKLVISVSAKISVQNLTKISQFFVASKVVFCLIFHV